MQFHKLTNLIGKWQCKNTNDKYKKTVVFKEAHAFLLSSYPTFLSPSAFTEINVHYIHFVFVFFLSVL